MSLFHPPYGCPRTRSPSPANEKRSRRRRRYLLRPRRHLALFIPPPTARVLRARAPRMKRPHSERALNESEAVGGLGYGLRGRLPVAVPGRGLNPQQDGRVGSLRLLQRGRELERVAGYHAVVVISRGQQRRRIVPPAHVVQGRVPAQPLVLLGILRVSILALPQPADREVVEAEHVEHPDIGDGRAEQLG